RGSRSSSRPGRSRRRSASLVKTIVAQLPSAAASRCHCLADGGDDLVLAREPERILLRHRLAVDEHDERADGAHLQLGLQPELLLQRSRRTGGSRLVTSRVAVLNLDHLTKITQRLVPASFRIVPGSPASYLALGEPAARVPSGQTMISVLKADDRFHTRTDWLDSWHTFSFADHYDPDRVGFRALRVLTDD